MRIGVAATPAVALPTLDWLFESIHEIALVISQPDRPAGRGRRIVSSDVSRWALNQKIPLLRPHSSEELRGYIEDLDCVLTIGYGVLLPEAIIKLPRHGFLNLHFSLLPAYRGAAPVQRAIERGESATGVTVFALDKGMDTGAIYSHAPLPINPKWRALELMNALALLGPQVVDEALRAIENRIQPAPQIGTPSIAPKISKAEAKIDWNLHSEKILDQIRGFFPRPCAWSHFRGVVMKFSAAERMDAALSPGEICVIDGNLIVGCADSSALALLRVLQGGKKEMSGVEWSRGANLQGGERFD